MSVGRGSIWGAATPRARLLDRRDFLGSVAALAAASGAAPLRARGPASFYANRLARLPRADGCKAYVAAHAALRLNKRLYERMWGSSEFISTGTLKDYDGEPLLAKLDGARTLFIDGQYDEARLSTLGGFAARFSGAEFAVIPGAGHAFILDRPEEALEILRPWLQRQDRA